MKHYEELWDDCGNSAVQKLNKLLKSHKTKVIGYQVVGENPAFEPVTYILVEVSE